MSKAQVSQVTAPKAVVTRRIREAGIDADPFVNLENGSKKPSGNHVLYPTPPAGNYGVYSVEDLVILDVDPYEADLDLPVDLPPTFTTGTPHGGKHRLYLAPALDRGTGTDGGSLRVTNQYGVGPGSVLTSCDMDWHDCSQPGEGHYRIKRDFPIATLDEATAEALLDAAGGATGSDHRSSSAAGIAEPGVTDGSRLSMDRKGVSIEDVRRGIEAGTTSGPVTLSGDEWQAIEVTRDVRPDGQVEALLRGEYAVAGFPGDRSAAELSLMDVLAFALDNDPAAVARIMTWACQRWPGTDEDEPRKWADRPDVYREDTLAAACTQRRTYSPPGELLPYEDRQTVGGPLKERVIDAIRDLDCPTFGTILEHNRVDRKKRQVRRALRELEDEGTIIQEDHPQDRRKDIYRFTGSAD